MYLIIRIQVAGIEYDPVLVESGCLIKKVELVQDITAPSIHAKPSRQSLRTKGVLLVGDARRLQIAEHACTHGGRGRSPSHGVIIVFLLLRHTVLIV